jgi:hypothetical protein
VNYRSRSFKEGKKVSMIGDPISWLKACIRLRCTSVDPMAVIEQTRREPAYTQDSAPVAAL